MVFHNFYEDLREFPGSFIYQIRSFLVNLSKKLSGECQVHHKVSEQEVPQSGKT